LVSVEAVDESFPKVIQRLLPNPVAKVRGSQHVDISPRVLDGVLSIHLVNTSGPHANPPAGGIAEIKPIGPLVVTIRLDQKPRAITRQPEGEQLEVIWTEGQATVTVPELELYSILIVDR
jgi:hypothetical protein